MNQDLEVFADYLKQNDKSDNTISSYVESVRQFMNWYYEKFKEYPDRLLEENILSFKQYLTNGNYSKSPMTINVRLNALKTYNQFLKSEGVMEEMIVHASMYQKVQSPLTSLNKFEASDINRFYQALLTDDTQQEKYQYRNFTIAKTLGLTGVRISELLNLKIENVHISTGELIVENGKGEKMRTVLINQELTRILDKYLGYIRPKFQKGERPELFLNRTAGPLSRKTIYEIFQTVSQRLAFTIPLTPHDLRHFFCSKAIDAGLDVHEVAHIAGHANVQTTLRYTNVSRKQLLDKLDQL